MLRVSYVVVNSIRDKTYAVKVKAK